jgi:hypothetical protein
MNVIIFLVITAVFSVQVNAKNSYEDSHMRGTQKDNADVMKRVHDIFLDPRIQPVLSAKSNRDVLTSPLAQITEPGYFSLDTFTDTTCSNINNLAVGTSVLLNTCSLSENGKYTKVKRSFFSVIFLKYS